MAFMAKDGSKHTNRETMRRSDASYMAKQPSPMAGGSADDEMMGGGEGDAQDGAAMAQEHGPAIETNIQHDHKAGSHKVHAVHPDGHEHDTEHGSADEAHKYAADCAGVGSGMG